VIGRRAFLGGAAALAAVPAQAAPAACALVLAVDVSGSVNEERFQLQRLGYRRALTHPSIARRIEQSPFGAIAVIYLEWSGLAQQRVIVPWQRLSTRASLEAFSDTLANAPRPFEGMTAIGAALEFSVNAFDLCPFPAPRRVVDISGDGDSNDGPSPQGVRDRAAARDIVINGLPIDAEPNEPMRVANYYRDNVVGGENAFTMPVDSYETAAFGLMAKLSREIG
jgi:hypothetical protein